MSSKPAIPQMATIFSPSDSDGKHAQVLHALHHGVKQPATPHRPVSLSSPSSLPSPYSSSSDAITPSSRRFPETLHKLITVSSSSPSSISTADSNLSTTSTTATTATDLGVFAMCDIPAGSILLCERPLLFIPHQSSKTHSAIHSTDEQMNTLVKALSCADRKAWDAFGWFEGEERRGWGRNRMVRGTNSFEICSGGSGGGRDDDVNVEDEDGQEQRKGEMRGRGRGSGVFEIGSRINHSCVPNSEWTWIESIGSMMFWNRFPLMEGEEVTIDYGHTKEELWLSYGFVCECGGCTESDDESGSESDD